MIEVLFNNENMARVLEFLIVHERWEQNRKEMCEMFNISTKKMKKILETLSELNIITITRYSKKNVFYKIISDYPLVKTIRILINQVSTIIINQTDVDSKENDNI